MHQAAQGLEQGVGAALQHEPEILVVGVRRMPARLDGPALPRHAHVHAQHVVADPIDQEAQQVIQMAPRQVAVAGPQQFDFMDEGMVRLAMLRHMPGIAADGLHPFLFLAEMDPRIHQHGGAGRLQVAGPDVLGGHAQGDQAIDQVDQLPVLRIDGLDPGLERIAPGEQFHDDLSYGFRHAVPESSGGPPAKTPRSQARAASSGIGRLIR
ncbi:hypothetical protein CDEN61S_00834 [Castellaniella denitrificans]